MTALADLVGSDPQRLLERVSELADLDRLMRERGILAEPDAPTPPNPHEPRRQQGEGDRVRRDGKWCTLPGA